MGKKKTNNHQDRIIDDIMHAAFAGDMSSGRHWLADYGQRIGENFEQWHARTEKSNLKAANGRRRKKSVS